MTPKRLSLWLVCLAVPACTFPDAPKTEPAPQPKKTQAIKPKDEGLPTSTIELYSAYEKNGADADKEFRDKLLIVESTIKSVGEENGSPYIELYVPIAGGGAFLRCVFEAKDQADVLKSKPGGNITIKGRGAGAQGGFVTLDHCRIVRYREPK